MLTLGVAWAKVCLAGGCGLQLQTDSPQHLEDLETKGPQKMYCYGSLFFVSVNASLVRAFHEQGCCLQNCKYIFLVCLNEYTRIDTITEKIESCTIPIWGMPPVHGLLLP